jgi:copper chaperone CopZ
VEKALVSVEGYKRMQADVTKEEVQVEYDPAKTNPQALADAITKGTEFKASVPAM